MIVTVPSASIFTNASGIERRGRRTLRQRFRRVEMQREQHAAAGDGADTQEGASVEEFRSHGVLLYCAPAPCAVDVERGLPSDAARWMASRMRT